MKNSQPLLKEIFEAVQDHLSSYLTDLYYDMIKLEVMPIDDTFVLAVRKTGTWSCCHSELHKSLVKTVVEQNAEYENYKFFLIKKDKNSPGDPNSITQMFGEVIEVSRKQMIDIIEFHNRVTETV